MKSPRDEDEEDANLMALVPIDENDVKADSNDQSYEANDLDDVDNINMAMMVIMMWSKIPRKRGHLQKT